MIARDAILVGFSASAASAAARRCAVVLDPDEETGPTVSVLLRRGPSIEVLQAAARDPSVVALGGVHWCRHTDPAELLRRRVDCPVVVVPAVREATNSAARDG